MEADRTHRGCDDQIFDACVTGKKLFTETTVESWQKLVKEAFD
jgi:hypothetical protein